MTIRTRVAPSPTGDPHVGTAYVALFNYCLARQAGGQFLLRIEDTDQKRSTRKAEDAILQSLRWLGLDWDEGPDVGGPHGPYRQSERRATYTEYAERLLAEDNAFWCFCTTERLNALRKEQLANKGAVGYDGHCMHLSTEEVHRRRAAGTPAVVRMKVPRTGECCSEDLLRGTIRIPWAEVDYQVLLKADGMPTYHLASVVDDHLMKITHVVRGEEWISSLPKHALLHRYLGFELPQYCHLPLLRNPDKSKLSKRKNPTSIRYYERMGFAPEALLNYLGRMGWSMPGDEEKFSLPQMVQAFDLRRVSLGGPIFDLDKLKWLNGRYIREDFSPDQLIERLQSWALNRENLARVLPLIQQRVDIYTEVMPKIAHFLVGMPEIDAESFTHKKIDADQCRKTLYLSGLALDTVAEWSASDIRACLESVGAGLDLKIRDLLFPLFIAICGQAVSTPLFETIELLGRDLVRVRLRHGLDVLGGLSKKQLKALDESYSTLRLDTQTAPE